MCQNITLYKTEDLIRREKEKTRNYIDKLIPQETFIIIIGLPRSNDRLADGIECYIVVF